MKMNIINRFMSLNIGYLIDSEAQRLNRTCIIDKRIACKPCENVKDLGFNLASIVLN